MTAHPASPPMVAHPAASVADEVRRAAERAGRSPDGVCLMAVSKTRSAAEVAEVAEAADAGIVDFGENYLQDALPKIRTLEGRGLVWHFIGAIQSNKTRDIARSFHWVHTLARPRIAERLQGHRDGLPPLDVCIQVNVDAEPGKAGVAPGAIGELLRTVTACDRLRLRGLMVIPAPRADPRDMRSSFARTRELFEAHRSVGGAHWDTLSMGMSADFAIAIEEGSTCVRIGTAIFGPRGA